MCGLVGLVNKNTNGFSAEQKDVFSTLLYLDVLRGDDSTGVFMVDTSGDVFGAKDAVEPAEFLKAPEFKSIMQKAWNNGAAMIGHNRKATRGTVSAENAHPFVVDDNIILVHNGTMFGDHKKHADVSVDSHAIAHLIHKHESVEKALSSFDAAYALIWFDVKNQTLNFVRNSQRPLCWTETNTSYIWASSQAMLQFAIDHFDLKLKGQPAEIHTLPEDTLTFFNLKNRTWDVDTKKLTITKEYPKSTYTNNTSQAWENYRRGQHPYAFGYESDEVDLDPVRQVTQLFSITEWERNYCKNNNKTMLQGDVHTAYQQFPCGSKQFAIAYDYHYANGKDGESGWNLYLTLCENPDILVRAWFSPKAASEERMVQIAGGQWVFKVTISNKAWNSLETGVVGASTLGYTIFGASAVELVHGGGVHSDDYAEATVQ